MSLAPAWAEGNRLLPFWGQPYPAYYAYQHPPAQPNPCYVWRDVDTFSGPRRERVYVCDGAVTTKY